MKVKDLVLNKHYVGHQPPNERTNVRYGGVLQEGLRYSGEHVFHPVEEGIDKGMICTDEQVQKYIREIGGTDKGEG